MKFSDFVCKDAVRTQLDANEKESVIRAMTSSLLEADKINEEDYESIVEAILKREELGSTGIGRGVAVPHTKHPSIDRLIGTVAISEEGVVHIIEAGSSYRLIRSIPLGEITLATPAITDGMIIFRTTSHLIGISGQE